jgi:acyl-CoA thioester hydrolase
MKFSPERITLTGVLMHQLFRFKTDIQVTFDDLDAYKVVHNSKYLIYFERGRTAYLQYLRLIPPGEEGLAKIDSVVIENYCSYLKPALFDDVITIYVRISYLKKSSLQFQYILTKNNDTAVIALGYTTLVRVLFSKFKPISFEVAFRHTIISFEGDNLGKMIGIPKLDPK